ncbi:MAG: hypothetical protein ACREYC_02805, partial [Gammaproteobacteria bacterium]
MSEEQRVEYDDLVVLEQRLDQLIHAVETLASENEVLRAEQAALTAERAGLVEKTETARVRVEA